MTPAVRLWVFSVCACGLAVLFGWGLLGLPAFGHYRGPYGDVVNALSLPERRITDAVTAVNFDVRAFDTLGEEFILFVSVMGVALLLRKQAGDEPGPGPDRSAARAVPRASDAVRILTVSLVGPVVLFGLYVATHGQVSPGGGFQGGVILATAPLLVYLAGEFRRLRSIAPFLLVETAEAVGAGGFIVVGGIGYVTQKSFLQNTLPLGQAGDVWSGGMVLLLNLTVALAVSAGFLMLLLTYLAETLSDKDAI